MSHRAHLFSLRFAHALREACFVENYSRARLIGDILAGLTVGIIAIPLSMALAIASGVAPQFGLYTAIVGGLVIAIAGGSRMSISGPTAAFVVVLFPIVQQYGIAGLLLASLMSGVILILVAYMRLGRFIEYIPEPVTLGFTSGIGLVIATMQIKDFMGLPIEQTPEHFLDKIVLLSNTVSLFDWPSLLVASFTLLVLLVWPKFKVNIPPHLPAVLLGSALSLILNHYGYLVDTIGTRFNYILPDGSTGFGIPADLPSFELPWNQAGANGEPLLINWILIRALVPAAFAIAMLAAIESLLCAVVLDNMSGKRHSANSELLGQGIGNVITPFFGGITATAAIARSATNFKAGATSPVAAIVHALVVLIGLIVLAPTLAYFPMPVMAALLMMVAWHMSEVPKAIRLIKKAPLGDIYVFITCFSLTVIFDMVIAITTGILLAAILFMKEIAERTTLTEITHNKKLIEVVLPKGWFVYKVNGPLFFAAADRIFSEVISILSNVDGVILYLEAVPLLDAGGLSAMNKCIDYCKRNNKQIIFTDFQFQPLKTIARSKIVTEAGVSQFYPCLDKALESIIQINNIQSKNTTSYREDSL